MNSNDPKFREIFAALRADDADRVPPFRLPPDAIRSPREMFPVWALRSSWIAAGAAAVVAFVLFRADSLVRTEPSVASAEDWSALSDWTAPTDKLLASSGTVWETSSMTDAWIAGQADGSAMSSAKD
ncbi:MAG: hypothetical protein WCI38_03035 [Chthoniobacterales bacterium]